MKKIIKKTGGSMGIYFSKDEQKAYNLEVGKVIEFDLIGINIQESKIFNVAPRIHVKSIPNEKDIDWKKLNELVDKDIQNDFKGESDGSSA